MDATLLTRRDFWDDETPALPGDPRLAGHVLFETSGSSGVPKQVALSKSALQVSAAAVNRHLGVTAESCWGLALPTRHVGGFGVAARAFEAGCRFHQFESRWDAETFANWLEENEVTHTSLVPTQVHDLVASGRIAPESLKAIVVGGGHLDRQTGQRARELGWPVLASYGMTEAGSQIATQEPADLGSPYEPAPIPLLPIWDARVGEDGALSISGPALFSGYVVGGIFTPRAADWHTTSDRAELAGRGLTPLGRLDSLVKVLGELVDPEAIEREMVLLSAGRLSPLDLAVAALPDERTEHRLVPVFLSSVDPQTAAFLLADYNAQAPGFRRLTKPVFLSSIARSQIGKPLRSAIAQIVLLEDRKYAK
ncbi:MAG: AMP-binding protein [Verrucomicrobiae bacterium]|nr:AMP-binding protein [Verrucomicrobiae bacterium]